MASLCQRPLNLVLGEPGTLHSHSMPTEQLKAWRPAPEWLLESWLCAFRMCDLGQVLSLSVPPSRTFLVGC